MLARYAAQSIKCTMMALRFTRQISAIFAHSLKVSGIRCHKPILRFALPANVHAYCRGPANTLSTATRLARLHEPKKGSAAFVHMHALKSMRLCADTSWGAGGARSLARSLPALQFPSLTLNQSFLIYQKGFVSWRLMPTPIRGKKTTQQQWKSQSKSLLWCDYTHNQIRADLNRHRTQNHIKGNSMWMALHCSQSPFPKPPYPLSALLSLILSLTFFLHFSLSLFCHHHHCLLIFLSPVTWKIPNQWLIFSSSLSWSSVFCSQH